MVFLVGAQGLTEIVGFKDESTHGIYSQLVQPADEIDQILVYNSQGNAPFVDHELLEPLPDVVGRRRLGRGVPVHALSWLVLLDDLGLS